MGKLKTSDVIAAMFFLIMVPLMESSVDEQTNVANTPLLELAAEVFDGTGCRRVEMGNAEPGQIH